MEKKAFLTIVAEVMKGMITRDTMMSSIQRSCLRGETANLELMKIEEKRVDALVEGMTAVEAMEVSEETLDALVLRYLKNTQFLAGITETDIDVSMIGDGDLNYWKKAMLFKAPDLPIVQCGGEDKD